MTTLTSVSTPAATQPDVVRGVRPIPFGRLLRVEWRKSTDTRASRWLLVLVAVLAAGVIAVPVAVTSIEQTFTEYLGLPAFVLTTLLPVVTILAATAEWSQRSAVVTFTQEPRRGRVLAAKACCSLVLSGLATAYLLGVSAAGLLVSDLLGRDVSWTFGWQVAVGTVAFVALNLGMALAFGTLLHNSAAAIVLYFLLPIVWSVLAAFPVFRGVSEWLNPGATFGLVQAGTWNGHWPEIATSVAVWVLLAMAAGVVRTLRREVT